MTKPECDPSTFVFRHSFVIRASSFVFSLLFILASCSNLFACAACAGGKTDSELAQGMNAGIFTLLGVIGIVLAGAASFGFYLVRRASRMSQLTGNEPVAQPTI
jgi:hypothetical protein